MISCILIASCRWRRVYLQIVTTERNMDFLLYICGLWILTGRIMADTFSLLDNFLMKCLQCHIFYTSDCNACLLLATCLAYSQTLKVDGVYSYKTSVNLYRTTRHYKVNLSLCHDDIWASGGIASPFLISALDGGEWSASRFHRFSPGKIAPGNHCIGGWMGPRAVMDVSEKRNRIASQKILFFRATGVKPPSPTTADPRYKAF
jgi:hypothetical protein